MLLLIHDAHSQVLDGAYPKEQPSQWPVYNHWLTDQVHNDHFRTTKDPSDTSSSSLDPVFLNIMRKYSSFPPLKFNDCVYFKPFEKYVGNREDAPNAEVRERFYLLNKTYGSQPPYEGLATLPHSLRFYVDTQDVTIVPRQSHLLLKADFNVPVEDYLKPFHFRKFEVTNKEYREFIQWTKDSIARQTLFDAGFGIFGTRTASGRVHLNRDQPIEWSKVEYGEVLEGLFFTESTRFYRRKEIDTRKLNYRYHEEGDTINEAVLNIYPDTLCWVHDFTFSFNEPMTNGYLWHPMYDDHPVVGVSYWQALAFLHWKTKIHQQELDRKGMKLKIRYDLPTEIQWDMAATAEKDKERIGVFSTNYGYLSDRNWITDLKLASSRIETVDSVSNGRKYITWWQDRLFDLLNHHFKFDFNFVMDGSFHTTKSNIDLIDKKNRNHMLAMHTDPTGIHYMGGNVSEWLKDPYGRWKPVFDLRQKQLETFDDKDVTILSLIEKHYDENNDADGRLVRGSNWYDERFSDRLGKNTAGMSAKVFVSPDKAYSTVGFRYVIFIERVD